MKKLLLGAWLLVLFAGLLALPAARVAGTPQANLLQNAGFEDNGTGAPWSKYGGTLSIITNPVHGGAQAAGHQDTSSNSTKWLRQNVSVAAGTGYEFSAWTYYPAASPSADAVFIRVAWYSTADCSGSQLGTIDGDSLNLSLRDSWQQLTGTATAPAGAQCAQLRLVLDPATGQDPAIYWDDANFASTAPPPATDTPTLTPTPTTGPTATWTPTAVPPPGGITLNEYMPRPSSGDEYVELFNANAFAVDLNGWQIDDIENGGKAPTAIAGIIPAGGVLKFDFTNVFNNGGDDVRLLAPDGSVRDSTSYGSAAAGVAWSRYPNGSGPWRTDLPPSPGALNPPPPPTDTPTPTPTHTPTPTRTPTPSPTPTPTPIPTGIRLNEFMPAPAAGNEYVELFNANGFPVAVGGWQIDDIAGGSAPYTVPAGTTIAAGGHWHVERNFGLNNSGDSVRLLAPDGSLRDSQSYTDAEDGVPWSRFPDGSGAWTDKLPASPGQPNRAAVLTLSGKLFLGQPPDRHTPIRGHYIGLYGWDAPETPGNWLQNAVTGADGSYNLVFDTGGALYSYYSLRPAPREGFTWAGVSSARGIALPPDRIRFDRPASGVYADNDFWMAPLPTATPTVTPLPPDLIVINEFLPSPRAIDWDGDGEANFEDEYIELYNPQARALDLSGWQLDDMAAGSSAYTLAPGTSIPAHGFLLFFRAETGIALNNGGDSVRLLAPDGVTEVDRFDYDSSRADTAWSRTSDGGGVWTMDYPPSPGGPNLPPAATPTPTPTPTLTPSPTRTSSPSPGPSPTPTPTPTLTPTPTASPTPPATATPVPSGFVVINEFLPAPVEMPDEYIELYNPQAQALDLSGWRLDDIAGGGTQPYTLPPGTVISARGFLLFFRADTGIALNNAGDSVRLLAPDGVTEIDHFEYDSAESDTAWSRTSDGGGVWTMDYPPSPGGPNLPATPGPSPTPSPTPTITPTPSATPSVTASPTALPPRFVRLNELLPAPRTIDFDGDGVADMNDEYIELFNPQPFAIDLGGWLLDDEDDGDVPAAEGSRPYTLPPGTTIAGQGYLLFFRAETGIALNNDGDSARLLGPDGSEIDLFSYDAGHADTAWSRTAAGSWTESYPPSPGRENLPAPATPTPTPTLTPTLTPTALPTPAPGAVALNELLPAPRLVDWDGDGEAAFTDEWIELFNGGDAPADLGGWRLWKGEIDAGGLPDGYYYALPPGTVIAAHGYLLIFQRQSDLSLPNDSGRLHLVRPFAGGWRIESSFFTYQFPGYDRSFSRYPDGTGPWGVMDITPGLPNHPFPDPDPDPPSSGGSDPGLGVGVEAIARVYQLAPDTRITVEGNVTVPPGLFDARIVYIQDETAGVKLYLRSGDYPGLHLGDRLRATGYVREFHGQREISVPAPTWLTALGPGTVPQPRYLRSGSVGERSEARLVLAVGRITGFRGQNFWLDDGSGGVEVSLDEALSWQRPYLTLGDEWAVVGVVGQWDDSYRIFPRYQADISPPPGMLPVTGARP